MMNIANFLYAYINHKITMYAIKNKFFLGPYNSGPYNMYQNDVIEPR